MHRERALQHAFMALDLLAKGGHDEATRPREMIRRMHDQAVRRRVWAESSETTQAAGN